MSPQRDAASGTCANAMRAERGKAGVNRMTPTLCPLGRLTVTVRERVRVDGVPLGARVVGEADECRWEGDRVRAVQQGRAGSDWLTIGAGGVCAIDARMTFRTEDGAVIFMRYGDRVRLVDAVPTDLVAAPTFETAAPRYAWLNTVQAVAIGRRDGSDLAYDMFEVVPNER